MKSKSKKSLSTKSQNAWKKGIKTAATKPKTQKSKAGAELTGTVK